MPAFLVGMAGPHLIVAGAIYLGGAISTTLTGYKSLTQTLPFTPLDPDFVNSHDQLVWRTAHTLVALRKSLDLLDKYYENLQLRRGSVSSGVLCPAPHFQEFKSENRLFTLTYRSHLLGDELSPRSVFLADAVFGPETESRIQCVVKFVERYGKKGHEIMAEAGVAPELMYCKWEATVGLWVVVTRYYESQVGRVPTPDSINDLGKGLARLHEAGLVHGDIREGNILVGTEGRAWLIDFDWCEQVGRARYPSLLNPKVKWVPGVEPSKLIKPEHDDDMFASYLEDLKRRKGPGSV